MRVQSSDIYEAARSQVMSLPLFLANVPAGFPSPADDYIDRKLDLNSYLITHPAATYFVRVSGDSMTGAGIFPGDIMIVDRAIESADNRVVIACVDGELTVKRLRKRGKKISLVPENIEYPTIEVTEDMNLEIWGVVTSVIHHV